MFGRGTIEESAYKKATTFRNSYLINFSPPKLGRLCSKQSQTEDLTSKDPSIAPPLSLSPQSNIAHMSVSEYRTHATIQQARSPLAARELDHVLTCYSLARSQFTYQYNVYRHQWYW